MNQPPGVERGALVPPEPRVSVVIPTYRPAYLEAALESVRAQTWRDFEIVLVDDGSPEPVRPGVCDDLVLVRQANAGPGAARNRGIQEARGQLVALLDHDDLWLPDKLRQQVAWHDAHPETVLSCVDIATLGRPEAPTFLHRYHGATRLVTLDDLLRENVLGTCGVMLRRDAALAVGGFDVAQRYTDDYRMWLELATYGQLAFIDEVLALYRVDEASLTGQGRKAGEWQTAELQVYEKFYAAHPEYRTRPAARDGLARAWFDKGYAMLQLREFAQARQAFGKSLAQRPLRRRAWLNLGRALFRVPVGGN
ncbi:MAG: glycosyltransferase family 2 protein [Armatimonadetes bacterium]|nr:glycosyltransferase family 2 protein [Armatimonadota bacterium]